MRKQGQKIVALFVLSVVLTLWLVRSVNAEVQSPITRLEVEERALNMINYSWTFSSTSNTNIDSKYTSYVTLPDYLGGLSTANVTGIPYNWGGIGQPLYKFGQ